MGKNRQLSADFDIQRRSELYDTAAQVITSLLFDYGVDCLALGEFTSDDILEINRRTNLQGYRYLGNPEKQGRLVFDTAVLFKESELSYVADEVLIGPRGNSQLRLAHQISFQSDAQLPEIYLYVVHWSSRIWVPENDPRRDTMGYRLQDELRKTADGIQSDFYGLVLGDFNDEPFNTSLSAHLLATRDRTLAAKNNTYLYNPFWRMLGEFEPYPSASYGGTHYNKNGVDSKWSTLDQLVCSSAFLTPGGWELNETNIEIITPDPLGQMVPDRKQLVDHFPIIGEIESK